ncbi:hypothetical protein [Cardinium endosymbiont of Tipula unca]|uniref:hypothetical protein n=1 Tax=Cardinium endosymbiont of Tipula unca TaxID=3066216 RepID=UPI0030D1DCD2
MLIFSIRLLVKIVVLATCTKACFLSQKVYSIRWTSLKHKNLDLYFLQHTILLTAAKFA